MFSVYVILCSKKRAYVGQTKRWRLQTRWEEHCDPYCFTTRWTSKYPPVEKIIVLDCKTYLESVKLEHAIVEFLMREYGLDFVRGGAVQYGL